MTSPSHQHHLFRPPSIATHHIHPNAHTSSAAISLHATSDDFEDSTTPFAITSASSLQSTLYSLQTPSTAHPHTSTGLVPIYALIPQSNEAPQISLTTTSITSTPITSTPITSTPITSTPITLTSTPTSTSTLASITAITAPATTPSQESTQSPPDETIVIDLNKTDSTENDRFSTTSTQSSSSSSFPSSTTSSLPSSSSLPSGSLESAMSKLSSPKRPTSISISATTKIEQSLHIAPTTKLISSPSSRLAPSTSPSLPIALQPRVHLSFELDPQSPASNASADIDSSDEETGSLTPTSPNDVPFASMQRNPSLSTTSPTSASAASSMIASPVMTHTKPSSNSTTIPTAINSILSPILQPLATATPPMRSPSPHNQHNAHSLPPITLTSLAESDDNQHFHPSKSFAYKRASPFQSASMSDLESNHQSSVLFSSGKALGDLGSKNLPLKSQIANTISPPIALNSSSGSNPPAPQNDRKSGPLSTLPSKTSSAAVQKESSTDSMLLFAYGLIVIGSVLCIISYLILIEHLIVLE
eukprot:TRINITY_DN7449_c1_g1_i11.p1 TRINITY_DN7449_c1_g1~~TRINITY_DN7449_c1_g1_i11.p1  ORF type:complete len:532 (+),score=123.77 TRINITY_DN7449_c1_g1_i11:86-1681(+)